MAITRRSAQFAEIANAVDQILAERGYDDISPAEVDAELNRRIEHEATMMRIGLRYATAYMPPDLAAWIADDLSPRIDWNFFQNLIT